MSCRTSAVSENTAWPVGTSTDVYRTLDASAGTTALSMLAHDKHRVAGSSLIS